MKHPISDAARKTYFPLMERKCNARLDSGGENYGDAGFKYSVNRIITEIQEELEDTRNYAAMGWVNLEKVRDLLAGIESITNDPCKKHPKYEPVAPPKNRCEYCWYLYVINKIKHDILMLDGDI